MANNLLLTVPVNGVINDVILLESEEDVTLEIITGDTLKKITIETYHDQDCCEHVYGDFSILKYYKELLIGKEISNLLIKGIEDMGFLLCFDVKFSNTVKVFIPCYNCQNGYYSDELKLKVHNGHETVEIDISSLVEDDIG